MPNIELKSHTNKVVHVSVAVIERYHTPSNRKEILISKRPDHVHQGGLWEFPGGKVEPGETVLNALDRELFEELDIHINRSGGELESLRNHQLIQIKHDYSDKTVFLDVWRIQSFSGTPIGKEGQEIRWIDAHRLHQFDFPAANKSIITACLLPNRYFITPSYTSVLDAEKAMDLALSQNARLIYLRQPQLNESEYSSWVETLLFKRPELETRLVYQFNQTLEGFPGAGVHFSQKRMVDLHERPVSRECWFAVSCHNQLEIEHAMKLGADFVTLSPVLKTMTHPDYQTMGWDLFARLVLKSKIPVYGLGGLSFIDEPELIQSGAQGLAGIGFWQR